MRILPGGEASPATFCFSRVSANLSSCPLPAPGPPPLGNGGVPHSRPGSCPSSVLPGRTTRRAFSLSPSFSWDIARKNQLKLSPPLRSSHGFLQSRDRRFPIAGSVVSHAQGIPEGSLLRHELDGFLRQIDRPAWVTNFRKGSGGQHPGHAVVSRCVVGVDPERGLEFAEGPLLVLLGQQGVGQANVSRGVSRVDLERGLEFAGSPRVLLGKQSLAQADVGLRPEPVGARPPCEELIADWYSLMAPPGRSWRAGIGPGRSETRP